ncbi:MAG: response regulator [Lentisphaerae bacterium]|nr:response regulator [Lentisphaerota bacterium]
MSKQAPASGVSRHGGGGFVQRLRRLARKRRIFADRYHALYERSSLALFELDLQGVIRRTNARLPELLGCAPEALVSKRLCDLLHPDLRDAETEGAAELPSQPGAAVPLLPLRHRDGQVVWLQVTGARLTDDGNDSGTLCVGQDMTACRRAEEDRRAASEIEAREVAERDRRLAERTREAQRMESIGRLAGGVAHDFNNRLTVILGNANLIRFGAPPESTVARYVDVIEKSAIQAAQLTQQLLGFARRDRLHHKRVDLHRLIAEAITLLSPSIPRHIRLHQDLGARDSCVLGDAAQLRQVVINLVTNAIEAMADGGDVYVTTADLTLDGATGHASVGLSPGPYVGLRIQDTGTGIAPDILKNIFEPFFTTNRTGRSAGMGLAVVYGTVRNHGGCVEVASTVRRGATFTVYLPASKVIASQVAPAPVAGGRAPARVLVVDDEDGVRDVMVGLLARLGYHTATATNGQEAVEYYRSNGDAIDLVLVDMQMPVMDGQTCCRELRKLNPQVRMLIMTGCAGRDSQAGVAVREAQGYLQKPFAAETLAQELARILS